MMSLYSMASDWLNRGRVMRTCDQYALTGKRIPDVNRSQKQTVLCYSNVYYNFVIIFLLTHFTCEMTRS